MEIHQMCLSFCSTIPASAILVVMVVLILIFTGNIGGWIVDVDETETMAKARAECIARGGIVREECKVILSGTDPKMEQEIIIEGLGNLYCCKPYE